MDTPKGHRKQVKHYHDPGDFHELTFSCFGRRPLLTNDPWRRMLSKSIDRAMDRWGFRLQAFVFMPEHVHLLTVPMADKPRVDALLKAIKRPYSYRIKQQLMNAKSRLLDTLTVRERPNVRVFRFWQEGSGYDRNLTTVEAVLSSIDYMHMNPVRRGLCPRAEDWRWSSARFHCSDGQSIDEDLPTVDRVPPEFLF